MDILTQLLAGIVSTKKRSLGLPVPKPSTTNRSPQTAEGPWGTFGMSHQVSILADNLQR